MSDSAAPYDAREVGNYILKLANDAGQDVTQMSLLKIVFYAHGWYLASKGVALFRQPVEAWEHGPVIKVVRDAFKIFGNKPIKKFAEKVDLETGECVPVGCDLSHEDRIFVENVFKQYGRISAFDLSDMTHEPGSPWDRVWNSKAPIGRLGLRIKNEEIREYFLQMINRGTLH